jgi:hypothetical protein
VGRNKRFCVWRGLAVERLFGPGHLNTPPNRGDNVFPPPAESVVGFLFWGVGVGAGPEVEARFFPPSAPRLFSLVGGGFDPRA